MVLSATHDQPEGLAYLANYLAVLHGLLPDIVIQPELLRRLAMTENHELGDRHAPPAMSLSDLERLWGDSGQHAIADAAVRERCLASECPIPPPPPPPPADEQIWQRPLCA
jgi:hypothetical protein